MSSARDQHQDHDARASSADETTAIINASSTHSSNVPNYGASGPSISRTNSQRASAIETRGTRSRKRRSRQTNGADNSPTPEDEDKSWLSRLAEKYGSVELENKGSVARDHLALERTFLAWLRTSLSFASIGIAITQLFRLNTSIANPTPSSPAEHLRHVGKPLGATFIALSIVILFIGFHRYFESQHYVIRGKFPAGRGSIALVASVAGALIIASLVVVIVVAPTVFEKK